MLGLIRAGSGHGGGGRDLRADVFRGLALWFIFIDHVPGNRLGGFTLQNFALCDAAEAFVLLAGYAAGLAYGGLAGFTTMVANGLTPSTPMPLSKSAPMMPATWVPW